MKKQPFCPEATGKLAMIWLGQAGFLFQLPSGRQVLIDPYLSDSLYESTKSSAGFTYKRLSPAPFSADELKVAEIFCSHEHKDHLDAESLVPLTKDFQTRLFTNPISAERAEAFGVRKEQIHILCRNDSIDFGEYSVKALPAQHGTMAPEAMGLLFDFDGYRVYYAGDTALDKELLKDMEGSAPDLALLPINGAFGNLDSSEAAEYARFCSAKRCLPYHFWTFAGHGGDPMAFCKELPQRAPACELVMLTSGETLMLK